MNAANRICCSPMQACHMNSGEARCQLNVTSLSLNYVNQPTISCSVVCLPKHSNCKLKECLTTKGFVFVSTGRSLYVSSLCYVVLAKSYQ